MADRVDGGFWLGMSMFSGVPASVYAFSSSWQLGLLAVACTFGAFKYGSHLENIADQLRLEQEQRYREADQRQREHNVWMTAWDEAWRQYDEGEIDHLDLVGMLEELREY